MAYDPITETSSPARPAAQASPTPKADLTWLLEGLIKKIPYSKAALLLATDGMPKAAAGLDELQARDLAATNSGMFSLARSAGLQLDGRPGVRQVIAELDDQLLFVIEAGAGSLLAVFTECRADAGQVGHEMRQLVVSVEAHLETPERPPAAEVGETMT